MGDNYIKRVWDYTYPEQDDLAIVKDVLALKKKFNIQRVIIDDCPAASSIIQQLKKRSVNLKLMSFRKDKVNKYILFRSRLYAGKVVSYPDKALEAEMKSIEEVDLPQSTRIAAPKNGSDDRIDSFIISCFFFLEDKKGVKFYDWDELDNKKDKIERIKKNEL